MSRFSVLLPTAITGAVAGGIVAFAIAGTGGGSNSTVVETVTQRVPGAAVPTTLTKPQGMTINQIYRAASPGVVDITVISQQQSGAGAFGAPTTQQTEGEGAGVVYDRNGDILTDEHVVAGATSVTVHFQDGFSAPAKVLGADPSTDVAVIRVKAPVSELHPIPFADSAAAQVGDPVVAIGSPFGEPETVTAGIVSAVGRDITAPNNYTITGAIQTDAAINPGNSGGPLLDAYGRVVGLNDQIQTNSGSSAGIGFATPGNADVRVASAIIAGHPIRHAYVGVCLQPSQARGAQIATGPSQACTAPIAPGSPAAVAGLRPGDVIVAINGAPVGSTNAFINSIDRFTPGQTVTMTIRRGGHTARIKVTLKARPVSAPSG